MRWFQKYSSTHFDLPVLPHLTEAEKPLFREQVRKREEQQASKAAKLLWHAPVHLLIRMVTTSWGCSIFPPSPPPPFKRIANQLWPEKIQIPLAWVDRVKSRCSVPFCYKREEKRWIRKASFTYQFLAVSTVSRFHRWQYFGYPVSSLMACWRKWIISKLPGVWLLLMLDVDVKNIIIFARQITRFDCDFSSTQNIGLQRSKVTEGWIQLQYSGYCQPKATHHNRRTPCRHHTTEYQTQATPSSAISPTSSARMQSARATLAAQLTSPAGAGSWIFNPPQPSMHCQHLCWQRQYLPQPHTGAKLAASILNLRQSPLAAWYARMLTL